MTNPCYPGEMETSPESEFCESFPLNVLFTNTVGVPRKSNSFYLGRIRESLTEGEKDIWAELKDTKHEELRKVVFQAEVLCGKTERCEAEWFKHVDLRGIKYRLKVWAKTTLMARCCEKFRFYPVIERRVLVGEVMCMGEIYVKHRTPLMVREIHQPESWLETGQLFYSRFSNHWEHLHIGEVSN